MSSATSIDPSNAPSSELGTGRQGEAPARTASNGSMKSTDARASDSAFHPWQFFLLAGMLSATAVVILVTGQSPASIIILSLTVVAASLVGIGAHRALAPLVLPEAAELPTVTAGRTRAGLEREKLLALRTIKELEFDFAMGKIGKDDFDELGGRLRARAMRLMRQLDAGVGYKGVIEQELSTRLAAMATASSSTAARDARPHDLDEVSATDAAPLEESEDASLIDSAADESRPPACPSCSETNDTDARFCKHCGAKLSTV